MRPEPSARLIIVEGPLAGQTVPLTSTGTSVGRDVNSGICLPDLRVSRQHCTIEQSGQAWELRDLGSANGTFVNSIPVRTHRLADGDRISVGESTFLFA